MDAKKKKLQDDFFKAAGPNVRALAELFELSNDIGFYIKDVHGRIMAINRRNCEICNIRDAWDAIGLRSSDLFPKIKADSYMANDREVLRTGRPIRSRLNPYPSDDSRNFELTDIQPLRDARGRLIGTACAYLLTPESDVPPSRYSNMRGVSDYIQEHYAEPITVGRLAAYAKMSESTLNRAFREVFAVTPGKYVTITRLNAARRLLEETDKKLPEIALECGFCDQSHFCRTFKGNRGMTPVQYRNLHRRPR